MARTKCVSSKCVIFPILFMLLQGSTAQQNTYKGCVAGIGKNVTLQLDKPETPVWILNDQTSLNLTVHTGEMPFAVTITDRVWFKVIVSRVWDSTQDTCKIQSVKYPHFDKVIGCQTTSVTFEGDMPFIWTTCDQHPDTAAVANCNANLYHVKNSDQQFKQQVAAIVPHTATVLQLWVLPVAENTELRVQDRSVSIMAPNPNSSTTQNVTGNKWHKTLLSYDTAQLKVKFQVLTSTPPSIDYFGHPNVSEVVLSSLPDSFWLACQSSILEEFLLVPSRRKLIIATITIGIIIQMLLLILAYHSHKNKKSSRKYLKENIYGGFTRMVSRRGQNEVSSDSTVPRSNQLQVPTSSYDHPISDEHGNKTSSNTSLPISEKSPAHNKPKPKMPDPTFTNNENSHTHNKRKQRMPDPTFTNNENSHTHNKRKQRMPDPIFTNNENSHTHNKPKQRMPDPTFTNNENSHTHNKPKQRMPDPTFTNNENSHTHNKPKQRMPDPTFTNDENSYTHNKPKQRMPDPTFTNNEDSHEHSKPNSRTPNAIFPISEKSPAHKEPKPRMPDPTFPNTASHIYEPLYSKANEPPPIEQPLYFNIDETSFANQPLYSNSDELPPVEESLYSNS